MDNSVLFKIGYGLYVLTARKIDRRFRNVPQTLH